MALPYVKPGVTVNEIISPNLSPFLLDPNVICIVGPAQGYEEHVEVVTLDDNHPITLSASYADPSTIVIRDASNVLLTPFLKSQPGDPLDYDVDTTDLALQGEVRINRTMQTTIDDGEEVVVYYENDAAPVQADAETEFQTLNRLTTATLENATVDLQEASISVASKGLAPLADTSVVGEGTGTVTIVWVNTAAVLKKFQKVWLDFNVGATEYVDQEYQLNNLTTVALPANADNVVVKTAPGADTNVTAVLYDLGTTEDLDYMVIGTNQAAAIRRSQGTTTIGGSADKLVVRISYRATPLEYYQPTRCYSQTDVEDKFGSAFDSQGNVQNALSFATLLAFQNGASQVVAQALFTDTTPPTPPTGSQSDWQATLESLRAVQDISVIVPVIAAGDLSQNVTDSLNLLILQEVQNHMQFMAAQENKFMIAIMGEDGTSGSLASIATLQSHAEALGDHVMADSTVLLSPSSFTFANPITGRNSDVGGQYVAACVAGMLGRYPVQMPLTRKRISGINSLKVLRTETQKDQDAVAGCCVVENKRGRIQIRHSITTAKDTRARQELSVVRAKHWMMTNLVEALDTQAVGQLVLDAQANFLIQLLVSGQLELMIQEGAIVSYQNIQVRPDKYDPTTLQVRFSYLPAYPLNHIVISFSVDSTQGITFDQSTTTQGF